MQYGGSADLVREVSGSPCWRCLSRAGVGADDGSAGARPHCTRSHIHGGQRTQLAGLAFGAVRRESERADDTGEQCGIHICACEYVHFFTRQVTPLRRDRRRAGALTAAPRSRSPSSLLLRRTSCRVLLADWLALYAGADRVGRASCQRESSNLLSHGSLPSEQRPPR